MEITTILMIIFSVVLVVALILYFWPIFKKKSSKDGAKNSKKDKKAPKNKKDDYEDMVIYRGDANAENNKVGLEEPAPELDKTAQLEKELDSIKNYLKIPPPESAMNGDINNNQNNNQYSNPWGMMMPPQQNNNSWGISFDNENYDNSQIRLPSLEERYEEKLWDDDLSKRLYIDDQLEEKPQPYNPYLVRREKSVKDELSNLSPQMKKILISDMLKKKNH